MSPAVGNFVQDLVEMAKATEQLPQALADNERLKAALDASSQQVQDRELAISRYKEEIESLQAKVRSLEVERDDASFRVMEAEDHAHATLATARAIQEHLNGMIGQLDPPKPQPEPVHEAVKSIEEVQQEPVAPATEPVPVPTDRSGDVPNWAGPQGQSVADPTATSSQPSMSHTASIAESGDTSPVHSDTPPPGRYSGKRYFDHPYYVSLAGWLAEGGTEEDYNWRPAANKAVG